MQLPLSRCLKPICRHCFLLLWQAMYHDMMQGNGLKDSLWNVMILLALVMQGLLFCEIDVDYGIHYWIEVCPESYKPLGGLLEVCLDVFDGILQGQV